MKYLLLIAIFISMARVDLYAQPVLTPRNVALGGGGSTYITDYQANFYNPANLRIKESSTNIDVGVMIVGVYFNGVQNFTDINQQRNNLQDYFYAFEPNAYGITAVERDQILSDNYVRNRSLSRHQTRADITIFGIKWRKDDKAFAIALRDRISSSFDVGKGWYSNTPQQIDELNSVDRTLNHRYQSLYELSFGYAENFRFFTDMTPRLDEFSIGIAPKLVASGPVQLASWRNIYQEQDDGSIERIQEFQYRAAGSFARATDAYLQGTQANAALTSNLGNNLFDPVGVGAAVDIGFTYLITLGNDLSTIQDGNISTRKSLRLSFSITDLGLIHAFDDRIELSSVLDTTTVASMPTSGTIADDAFVGAPGQLLAFTDSFATGNPFSTASRSSGSSMFIMPTALNTGAMLEINKIKLMGDLTIGLTNTAFNSPKLVASAGIELRPLDFLPLRAGTQLATELPSFFSFGAAIETRLVDISLATQFVARTFDQNPTLSGFTAAAFQFHF